MKFSQEKILIAYYSYSGNTKKLAEMIQAIVGGDTHQIIPQQPYPADYDTVVAQAKKEAESHFLPPINGLPNLAAYTTIFVGSPVWWYTAAPPLFAFLSKADLKNKTLIPFITHEGGGQSNSFADIKKSQPEARTLSGFEARGSRLDSVQQELRSFFA